MMRYYKHKEKEDVICEVFDNIARFGKWVWNGNTCSEVFTQKEVTEDFKKAFVEISQSEYNNIWGIKLQQA